MHATTRAPKLSVVSDTVSFHINASARYYALVDRRGHNLRRCATRGHDAAASMTAETPPGSVPDNAPARAIAVCGAMKRVFPLRGVVGGWVRFSFPLTAPPVPTPFTSRFHVLP